MQEHRVVVDTQGHCQVPSVSRLFFQKQVLPGAGVPAIQAEPWHSLNLNPNAADTEGPPPLLEQTHF